MLRGGIVLGGGNDHKHCGQEKHTLAFMVAPAPILWHHMNMIYTVKYIQEGKRWKIEWKEICEGETLYTYRNSDLRQLEKKMPESLSYLFSGDKRLNLERGVVVDNIWGIGVPGPLA